MFHLLVPLYDALATPIKENLPAAFCFSYTTVENKKAHPIQSDELQYFDKNIERAI
ncbi:hypothetical protein [Lacibacter sp. H407]|uniref:hypothetical protein n=1 Tax=Lacibacter sp. H407 TaxID=3133423 RepID=UPI0030C1269C